jgi:Cdc6-like AAA superfamily ATPase
MAKALEADTKALNTNLFTKSSNITLDRVMHLFGADKIVSQEDPLFVFVIGSPGVGKTTQTRRYFGELYDSMYNVSLDTIVEHIEPYRNMTLHAYKNKVAHKKNLNENNYAHFSTIYLPIIQSEESNFSIANQNIKLRKRIFQCKFENNCNKLNSGPSKFYDHLRSHTFDKPYICEICL